MEYDEDGLVVVYNFGLGKWVKYDPETGEIHIPKNKKRHPKLTLVVNRSRQPLKDRRF